MEYEHMMDTMSKPDMVAAALVDKRPIMEEWLVALLHQWHAKTGSRVDLAEVARQAPTAVVSR